MPLQAQIRDGRKEFRMTEVGTWYRSRHDAERNGEPLYGADSARSYDKDGHLRIARTHISKSNVCPYYGREIPMSAGLGLDPDRIYYLLRDPEELSKAAHTFRGKPILFFKHVMTTADDHQTDRVCGAIGSDVEFLEPYLDADVTIWRADAIAGIETDRIREWSCAYRYVPIMTPGEYNGVRFDGKMTQIEGNHLLLCESGRAGTDVLAADRQIEREPMAHTKLGTALAFALTSAFPKVVIAQDSELDKLLADAKGKTFDKSRAKNLVLAMDSAVDGVKVDSLLDSICAMDAEEKEEKTEPAKDCKECGAKDGKHGKDCKIGKDKAAKDKAAKDERKEEDEEKEAKDAEPDDEDRKMGADSFNGLVEKLEKKGYSKEYATKVAGKVAVEKGDSRAAMDAKIQQVRRDLREAEEAKRDVRSVVGDVIAQDSAAEIYGFALDHLKVDRKGVEGVPALRALFRAANANQARPATTIATDHAGASQQFPGLARFRQA